MLYKAGRASGASMIGLPVLSKQSFPAVSLDSPLCTKEAPSTAHNKQEVPQSLNYPRVVLKDLPGTCKRCAAFLSLCMCGGRG